MPTSHKHGGTVARLEAGIDWLSATLPLGHRNSGQTYDAAMKFIEVLEAQGNTTKVAVLQGYRGIICGKVFLGESDQGLFCRATSGISGSFFEHIYTDGMHVSRLDLQVTVWIDNPAYHIGRDARQDAAYWRITHPKDGKRKIVAWDDEDNGYTLYIGSKASEHFCRLYDKGAESGETYYEGSWRYEIELHNDSATTAARYIEQNTSTVEAIICSTVEQYYRARGVIVPWNSGEALNAVQPAARVETDDARALKWLASQVAPSVRRLIKRGYLVSVLDALGLDQEDGSGVN